MADITTSLGGAEDVEPLVPRDLSRLLLVDDEPTILNLFRMLLEMEMPDRSLDLAGNGEEALEAFEVRHHGVVLMDLHMPVMDGLAAFARIQALCRSRRWEMPPVVFCTGFAPPDSIMSIIQADSRHKLLLKPVTCEALVDALRSGLPK